MVPRQNSPFRSLSTVSASLMRRILQGRLDFLPKSCKPEKGWSWVSTTSNPLSCAKSTSLAKKSYSLFAADTLALSCGPKPGKPSGHSADRKGLGPCMIFPVESRNLIFLANEQVPQGGARKTPTTKGDSSHCKSMLWSFSAVRPKRFAVATALSSLWSTPNASLIPTSLRLAVSLALPLKISMTTGHVNCSMLNAKPSATEDCIELTVEHRLWFTKPSMSSGFPTEGSPRCSWLWAVQAESLPMEWFAKLSSKLEPTSLTVIATVWLVCCWVKLPSSTRFLHESLEATDFEKLSQEKLLGPSSHRFDGLLVRLSPLSCGLTSQLDSCFWIPCIP